MQVRHKLWALHSNVQRKLRKLVSHSPKNFPALKYDSLKYGTLQINEEFPFLLRHHLSDGKPWKYRGDKVLSYGYQVEMFKPYNTDVFHQICHGFTDEEPKGYIDYLEYPQGSGRMLWGIEDLELA